MIIRKALPYILFLSLSILYVAFIFSLIPDNSFLFIGDQFFRFSAEETSSNAFYIRKMSNFGVFNAWQLTVQTPDIIYYSLVYKLGLNLIQAEQILFVLILFLTSSLSFIGFSKLSRLYIGQCERNVIIATTFWYTLNPYIMVLWHGGVYNLGSSLTYALAPLIIYYFHISITNYKVTRERIICALLLFVASFTFWMLAALIFLLFFYTVAICIIYRKALFGIFLNIIKVIGIYLPMVSMIIYPIFHEYANNKSDINGVFYPTFGEIKGGLLYQLLMWFSWGIYNKWTPRSLYPDIVTEFYMSPVYIGVTLLLYCLIGLLAYKTLKIHNWNKKEFLHHNSLFLVFFLIFFISIFFAKGQEPPLGGIFLYLYDNFPFFSIFRSSDHRFGFPAVLSLSIALLVITKRFVKNKYIALSIILITLFQNFIFLTGDLLIGQNIETKYVDRVVKISDPYQEAANYLNSQPGTFYVLPNPSTEYGTFYFDKGETHIGQDIMPKIVNKPFADVPVISGMHKPTGIALYNIITKDAPELLTYLPVKYILQRKDLDCPTCISFSPEALLEYADKDFENNLFEIYKLKNFTPIINSNNLLTYRVINPTRFEIELKNVKDIADLNLMQSYNSNWKLFILPYAEINCENKIPINDQTSECPVNLGIISPSDTRTKNNPEINLRTYPENLTHMNSWGISTTNLEQDYKPTYYMKNADGSYNVKLALFYTPQSSYIYSIYISIFSVVVSILVLLIPAHILKKLR